MIRELRVKVQNDGFRVDELILVTTMLDPEVDTKEELAELFLQRWNIELDLRSIKSGLASGSDHLEVFPQKFGLASS